MRLFRFLLFIVWVPSLIAQGTPRAQSVSDAYARLARSPVGAAEFLRSCGTPAAHALRTQMAVGEPMADGEPLRADQFPRFLTPTHAGEFGLDGVTVLGDQETVTFERYDPSQTPSISVETWRRTGTSAVGGRLISIFRPVWPAEMLHVALAGQRWGVDRPYLLWGHIVSPASRQPIYLQLAPTNVPSSEVVRISDRVQFASHAVNLWIPGFGDARVQGGDGEWGLPSLSRTFYQHFGDAYETLAIVTQSRELVAELGFRRNVRNGVAGIGLGLFDDTAQYGSAGVLQGVEVFSSPRWAENSTVLHQQAHQWSEYTGAWEAAGICPSGRCTLDPHAASHAWGGGSRRRPRGDASRGSACGRGGLCHRADDADDRVQPSDVVSHGISRQWRASHL